jgi:DNA-binding response OmpR family regulator
VRNRRPLPPVGPPRLLIVEDELLIALIIEEMAQDIGYRVSGVAHTVSRPASRLAASSRHDSGS